MSVLEQNIKALTIYHAKNDLVSPQQLAQISPFCEKTIVTYCKNGTIQAEKVGNKWVIPMIQFYTGLIDRIRANELYIEHD